MTKVRGILIATIAAATMLVAAVPANAEPVHRFLDPFNHGEGLVFRTKVDGVWVYYIRACDTNSDGYRVNAHLWVKGRGWVGHAHDKNGASERKGPGLCDYDKVAVAVDETVAIRVSWVDGDRKDGNDNGYRDSAQKVVPPPV